MSIYKFGFYGRITQLFSKTFNGSGGYYRGKKNINGLVRYDLFEVITLYGRKLKQLIRDFYSSLDHALELIVKYDLSTTDESFLLTLVNPDKTI